MGFNDTARNEMVTYESTQIDRVSLHTGNPGDTGANEVVGGTPPYARQIPTWGTAANGQINIASIGSHAIPAGTTLMFLGYWKDGATPVFKGFAPLGAFIGPFAMADAVADALHLPGHGLVLNNTIVLQTVVGKSLPAPLVESTVYYVRDVTTDTFKLALSAGGAAINLTGVGSGIVLSLVAETYPLQGTYTVSTGTVLKIR